jgi:hypothetical protein
VKFLQQYFPSSVKEKSSHVALENSLPSSSLQSSFDFHPNFRKFL